MTVAADAYRMDSHKLLWHLDRVVPWLRGERIAPLYIDMGITRTCTLACRYCYYAVPAHRSAALIPTERLTAFLGEAARIGVKAVGFLGDGEPMLHPGVETAVAAGAAAGLDMALSSNGVSLPREGLAEFLAGLVWIRFNVAATPASYVSVMQTDAAVFDRVTGNIRRCVEARRRHGLRTTIGLQMVLIEENAADIVPFARLGRELGVDYAVIKQCSESHGRELGLGDRGCERFAPLLREAEALSGDGYRVIVKWRKMGNRGVRGYDRCYGCEFLPQISGDGGVYPCGNLFGRPEFCAGSIAVESFADIVAGERYHAVLERVRTEVDVHRDCGVNCRQNEINEFLWQLRHPPEHVNFI